MPIDNSNPKPKPEGFVDASQEMLESASKVCEPSINPVGKELILPFEQMDEYDFERLCTRLAIRQTDVEGARRYGTRGEAQYGIDIYARWRDKDGYCVYQCKRYQKIDKKDLKEIIEKFVEDHKKTEAPVWLQRVTQFVLCATQPLEKAAFTDVVENMYPGLSKNLDLDVWDSVALTELLKTEPDIVEEFFGRKAAENLCGRGSLLEIKTKLKYEPDVLSPSQLLVASNRVVPFAGRDKTVQDLLDWCNTSPKFATQLITGAGGVGKTRLMLEFASSLRGKGWLAGFTRTTDDRNEQPLEWQALFERNKPTFIVIDYAESRSVLVTALLEAAEHSYQNRDHPIRLILLARGGGEWWDELRKQQLLHRAVTFPLPAVETSSNGSQRHSDFVRAAAAFAQALQVEPAPTSTHVNLEHTSFERLLFVHMVALLECQGVQLQSGDGTAVLDSTLDRERNHWNKQLAAHTPSLANLENRNGIERTMTLVTLGYPVPNFNAASTLIALDPILGKDLNAGSSRFLVKRLQTTYPGNNYINPIEPDLLAEHLIYTQLTHQDTGARLLETAFGKAGVEPDQMRVNPEQALAHLVHLAEWQPGAFSLWHTVFSGRSNNVPNDAGEPLLLTAMKLAREIPSHGTKLGNLLAEILELSEDQSLAMKAVVQLPNYSVSLLKFAAIAQQIVTQHYYGLIVKNQVEFLPILATTLNNLSNRQNDLGDREAALETIDIAVQIRRELVDKNRDTSLLDFAMSLHNQSRCQRNLGKRQAALETIQEAVKFFCELVDQDREEFLPYLADGLNSLSNCQNDLGDREDALETIGKATEIGRELIFKNRDTFLSNLAMSLTNQSSYQINLGFREAALDSISEAVKFYRELVDKNRDAFLPKLAASLNNQSSCHSALDASEAALKTIDEAIQIRSELVARNPQAFIPDLALSYGARGQILNANNQPLNARTSFAEGLRLLIPFAQQFPQAFERLAMGLIHDYISISTAAGCEPDVDLLKPLHDIYVTSVENDQIHEILDKSEPLLQGIALVASGDSTPRAEIEEALTTLEDNGIHLLELVQRIWAGERDSSTLTNGLDAQDSAIIKRILEIIQNLDQT